MKNNEVGKMKAIRMHSFGDPEVLQYEDVPIPKLGSGEVQIRVHAIGLNPPDWYLRNGYKDLPPEWQPNGDFPIIPGTDVSGVIEAVANDVNDFSVGDEVYSMVRFPEGVFGESQAYAEFVNVPASQVGFRPTQIEHKYSGAAPMSVLTAWQFLIDLGHNVENLVMPYQHKTVPLEGKTVVVNGAAGGVGHIALQLAKWKGARVIAVASGKQEEFVRSLGVDEFIDYTKSDAHKVLKDVDLVIDAVGGPATTRFLEIIKRGGALFPIFPLGFDDFEKAENLGIKVSATQVRSNGDQLTEIAELLNDGIVQIAIDSEFPLEDAAKAHKRAAQGHLQGKLVLHV